MSAYSLDLREKIVESVKKGVSKTETARRFGVDRATVKRFCKQLDERGTLEPRKAPGKRPKLDEKATKLLAKDLEERPWATLPLTALEDQSHRTVGVSTLMILCDDLKTRDRGTMQLAHVSMWPHPATVMKSEQAHYLLSYSPECVEGRGSRKSVAAKKRKPWVEPRERPRC